MATARFVLLWWAALFGWWIVLVGTNAGLELIAGACAALLGALSALALRRRGQLRYRVEGGWLLNLVRVPWRVAYELGVVFGALAMHLVGRRRITSRYRAFELPIAGNDPASRGRRALAAAADAISPNTLPVDVDPESGVALRHELDPRRASNDMP